MSGSLRKKPAFALLVLVPLVLGAASCGREASKSSEHTSSSSSLAGSASTASLIRGDQDMPGESDDRYDYGDDRDIRGYGHEGTSAQSKSVTDLVKRYFVAAAADNGAEACAMLVRTLAEGKGLTKAVPLADRPAPGSPVFAGKSCTQVADLLFELEHRLLVKEAASIYVTNMRVAGDHGLATLAFTTMPERWLALEREGSVWKIDALLDSEVP